MYGQFLYISNKENQENSTNIYNCYHSCCFINTSLPKNSKISNYQKLQVTLAPLINNLILLYLEIHQQHSQLKYIIIPSEKMQSKKYVNNPELPVFNIRKVNKKITGLGRNACDFNYGIADTEQEANLEFRNFSSVHKAIDPRKQKEMILDQSVNEAIVNSKIYGDLKRVYLQNKKKNQMHKKSLQQEIEKKKMEKLEAQQERERLQSQKQKYMGAINAMKQKLQAIRQTNQRYRESLNNRVSGQAQYISNLIMSMRFQAEYEHGIDPDQMTYQQLLQLQQKIGVVSKGLPSELIHSLPKLEVKTLSEEQCTFCLSNYEIGQIMTRLYSCKHEFHFECLEAWLGKEKVCPLCKQELEFQNPETGS